MRVRLGQAAGFAVMLAVSALPLQARALPAQVSPVNQPLPNQTTAPVRPAPVNPAPINRAGLADAGVAQLPVQYVYTFTLKNFRITNTRSLHNDTDYVSAAVSVGGKRYVTVPPIAMGNLNNGTYTVNATLPNVVVGPNEAIAFTYLIVNSGYAANNVAGALLATIFAAGGIAGTAAGALASGGTATVAGAVAGATGGAELAKLIVADCDGVVAATSHEWSGAALAKQVLGKTMTTEDNDPGTNSPTGCGANSQYYVEWSVTGNGVTSAPNAP
jgi:hypothetical protein